MSHRKRDKKSKNKSSTELFGEPDVAAPPCETTDSKAAREVTEAVVRSAWAAAQEWTVAWKVGSGHLKMVVDGLEGLEGDRVPEKAVHDAAKSVHGALVKMRGCVTTLQGLLQQLRKVEELEKKKEDDGGGGGPLFSTLTLHHMVLVLASVCNDYEQETRIKEAACRPLPSIRSPEGLNSALALWTNLAYLPPHHFPLKTLLRETQQL
ncbi:uncharacterized protein LOC127010403 isoform X2 [Eriocheir sinensis]|uniref:uncharacterized protein LOC127010403 isoform X2 n=1 Tax=Eriocheir sinensis TaxID=95602 RepID=UPI0021C5805B|nr:uncharacterized protein LOC127010403 isoform X2 [Eriocheir sinensis]